MADTVIAGKPSNVIGSPGANLVLKGLSIKIQWGNKFIDLIKNGKIAVENESILKSASSIDEISKDGIYIVEDLVYLVIDGNKIALSTVKDLYISFLEKQELEEVLKNTALTNIGLYYPTTKDVNIQAGLVYVEEDLTLYLVTDGKLIKYTTTTTAELGDIIKAVEIHGTQSLIIKVDNLDYIKFLEDLIQTFKDVVAFNNTKIMSEGATDISGFRLYNSTNIDGSILEIDTAIIRKKLIVNEYIDIKVEDFRKLMSGNLLTKNQKYRLYNFRNHWEMEEPDILENNPLTEQVKNVRPIIITASSTNSYYADTCFFLDNPEWTIHYDINYDDKVHHNTLYEEHYNYKKWGLENVPSRGIITYMKDEFGNEANYDFKHLRFLHKHVYSETDIRYRWYYTFSTVKSTKNDAGTIIAEEIIENSHQCKNNKVFLKNPWMASESPIESVSEEDATPTYTYAKNSGRVIIPDSKGYINAKDLAQNDPSFGPLGYVNNEYYYEYDKDGNICRFPPTDVYINPKDYVIFFTPEGEKNYFEGNDVRYFKRKLFINTPFKNNILEKSLIWLDNEIDKNIIIQNCTFRNIFRNNLIKANLDGCVFQGENYEEKPYSSTYKEDIENAYLGFNFNTINAEIKYSTFNKKTTGVTIAGIIKECIFNGIIATNAKTNVIGSSGSNLKLMNLEKCTFLGEIHSVNYNISVLFNKLYNCLFTYINEDTENPAAIGHLLSNIGTHFKIENCSDCLFTNSISNYGNLDITESQNSTFNGTITNSNILLFDVIKNSTIGLIEVAKNTGIIELHNITNCTSKSIKAKGANEGKVFMSNDTNCNINSIEINGGNFSAKENINCNINNIVIKGKSFTIAANVNCTINSINSTESTVNIQNCVATQIDSSLNFINSMGTLDKIIETNFQDLSQNTTLKFEGEINITNIKKSVFNAININVKATLDDLLSTSFAELISESKELILKNIYISEFEGFVKDSEISGITKDNPNTENVFLGNINLATIKGVIGSKFDIIEGTDTKLALLNNITNCTISAIVSGDLSNLNNCVIKSTYNEIGGKIPIDGIIVGAEDSTIIAQIDTPSKLETIKNCNVTGSIKKNTIIKDCEHTTILCVITESEIINCDYCEFKANITGSNLADLESCIFKHAVSGNTELIINWKNTEILTDIVGTTKYYDDNTETLITSSEYTQAYTEGDDLKVYAVSNVASVPRGTITMWSGTVNDDTRNSLFNLGWAICDGYEYEGYTVPNLVGRFIKGGTGEESKKLGGNSSITLATENLPQHTHTATIENAGAHAHTITVARVESGLTNQYLTTNGAKAVANYNNAKTTTTGGHNHTIIIDSAGNANPTAIEIEPPYYILAYIMKIK